MNENIQQNAWVLKEKELLEKLSLEISRDFSIPEKLAKKLIYKTHLSLKDLKNEVYIEETDDNLDNVILTEEDLNKLLSILDWARQIIEKSSKTEIEQLKTLLEKNDILEEIDSTIIKKLFSKKMIEKAKNPKKSSEHIMWITLWITNSTIIIMELLYNFSLWIITSIPDLISILKWDWEIESIKKI